VTVVTCMAAVDRKGKKRVCPPISLANGCRQVGPDLVTVAAPVGASPCHQPEGRPVWYERLRRSMVGCAQEQKLALHPLFLNRVDWPSLSA
jgi:hypothetical protein